MATVTLEDGSQLELSQEEFMLYLQATGKIAQPKTQAEIIAEKMIELRKENPAQAAIRETVNAASGKLTATQCAEIGVATSAAVHDERLLRESAELELAYQEADDTGEAVELGNYLVMPGKRVLPKHVRPGGVPPRPRRTIPFTKREMAVMEVLGKAYPEHLTTREIAEVLGEERWQRVSGIISGIFTAGRGVKRGAQHTWTLETWARHAQWVVDGTPSRRWPPKEERGT